MRYYIFTGIIVLFINFVYASDLQPFDKDGAIVMNMDTILFEKPDIKSIKITNFYNNNWREIELISQTNIKYNDSNETWYYINSYIVTNWQPPSTLYGWVKRSDLGGKNDFKPVNKIPEILIVESMVDIPDFLHIHIYSDGTYQIKKNKSNKTILLRGKVYQYQNIIMLGNERGEYFYYNENEYIKGLIPIITYSIYTNKSEFPDIGKPSSVLSGSIYILTGDNVNVRSEASTNSAVLVKLSKGAKVTLLKRSDIALTVGDKKGFWAYIDTGVKGKTGENIKGWIFDYYLKKEE